MTPTATLTFQNLMRYVKKTKHIYTIILAMKPSADSEMHMYFLVTIIVKVTAIAVIAKVYQPDMKSRRL